MSFDINIHCMIFHILEWFPSLDMVYLINVYLSYTYIRLWFHPKYILSFIFLTSKRTPTNKQLEIFHLYLLMGYIDSKSYLYMAIETAVDMVNHSIKEHHNAVPHPLEAEALTQAYTNNSPPSLPISQDNPYWGTLPP